MRPASIHSHTAIVATEGSALLSYIMFGEENGSFTEFQSSCCVIDLSIADRRQSVGRAGLKYWSVTRTHPPGLVTL